MDAELIVIYKGNPVDCEFIKEILNDNGIMTNLKNELMGTIAPWHISAGGFEPVEVEILAKDKVKALQLIDEFNNTK